MKVIYCIHDEKNYSINLIPAIESLFQNNPNAEVHILHKRLTNKKLLNKLEEKHKTTIHYKRIPDSDLALMEEIGYTTHLNIGTNIRLLIPKYFNEPVIYLDIDTIVCSNLDKVFLENKSKISGVTDKDLNISRSKKLNLKNYVNAGVLVLNCKLINFEEMFLGLKKSVHLLEDMNFVDQDLINIVFKESTSILPEKYNIQAGSKFESKEAPAILHFTGKKPWNYSYKHYKTPNYSKTYFRYRNSSPIGDRKLEGRTLFAIFNKKIGATKYFLKNLFNT